MRRRKDVTWRHRVARFLAPTPTPRHRASDRPWSPSLVRSEDMVHIGLAVTLLGIAGVVATYLH